MDDQHEYSVASVVKIFLPRKVSAVSEFQRTHAYISPEVLSEKRSTGEVQRIGNLLNGHVSLFQFGFRVDNDHIGYHIQYVASCHLFDCGTEVLQ